MPLASTHLVKDLRLNPLRNSRCRSVNLILNQACLENHCRIDRVAHQRRRGFIAHHDRQDHHFDQDGSEGQDHRAVGVADFFREQFGLMGDAHRGGDDEGDDDQTADQRDDLAAVQQPVFQRIGDARGDDGQ